MKQLLSLFFAFGIILPTQAAELRLLTPSVRQGQTIIAIFDQKPQQLIIDNKLAETFLYQNSYRAVIPTSRTIPLGTHTLAATFPNGILKNTFITITPAFKKMIILPVPPKLEQTPKQLVQNLTTTNTAIKKQVALVSRNTFFSTGFGLPLYDNRKISSRFGEIRKTGNEQITHLGTDFDAKKGVAVAAINAGVVIASYLDPIYGNSVFIDHGQGIYSLYLHLDKRMVGKEQKVEKGQKIGTVGETGLASAPHLHLSIKINGISVDPIQFVNSFR